MKKSIFVIVLFLLAMTSSAQEWVGVNKNKKERIQETLISSSEKEIVIDVNIGGFVKQSVKTPHGNQLIITGEDMAMMSVKGAPSLPMYPISMIIGDKAEMKVSVVKSEYVDFENVEVAPSKGDFSRKINPDNVPYTYGEVYQQDAFYPAQQADLGKPYIIRDYRGQNVMVYPYAYNPVTKTLRVYTYLRIVAEKVSDNGVNQKLNYRRNNKIDPEVKASYERRFINYQNENNLRYEFLEEEGKMLIICVEEYMEALQPLVDWKNISGRPTEIVSAKVTGKTDNLKSYIQTYYNENPDFVYLLLVGEHMNLPAYPLETSARSDNYYGMLEGNDYYEEVCVGRLPVNSVEDAKNQVNKIIHYERDINESAKWLSRASGIAADEGTGHYAEIDYQHIDYIRDTLLNYTYTEFSQYYAKINNPSATKMVADYNNGLGIINYCNHGNYDGWVVADFNNDNVHSMVNDNKLPFIWSVACNNGQFDHDECFAEAWMRAKNPSTGKPTGAIGGMFSWISQPWLPPMYGQDEMNAILTEWRPGYKHTLGGASCNGNKSILDKTPNVDGENTHNTWILFGDPSLMVRTEAPTHMNTTISQPALFLGMSELTVNAQTNFGIATLSVDNEVIASSYINDGTATLHFSPLSQPGTAKLVVIGYNKVTEIKELDIIPADNPYIIYNGHEILDDNGLIDYGETVNISMNIKNIGLQPTSNITVKLSSDSKYIEMLKDNATINTINSEEEINLENAFSFKVRPEVPNDTRIGFIVTCSNGTETWVTNFYQKAYAPVFSLSNIEVLSENGVLPGNTATLQMRFKNDGGAVARDILAEVFSSSDDIKFVEPVIKKDKVGAGMTFTITADFTIDPSVLIGSVYEIVCSVNADYASFVSNYELKVGRICEDFETADFSSHAWKIEGPAKWLIDSINAYEGKYCANTELMGGNKYAKLKLDLEVLDDGPMTFYVKTSCEYKYDYLEFLVDGFAVEKWSGETAWTLYTYNMKKGSHKIEWRYMKDSNTDEGEDKVWLDNIIFPPVSVVSVLDAVEKLAYNIEDNILTLTWRKNYSAEEYIVRREGDVVATVTETSFTENAIDDLVTYCIVAKNGNNYSAPAFILVDPNREFGEKIIDVETKKISLYPNPTSGVINVEIDNPFEAVVYNYQGQVVMRMRNNDRQIDMSHLTAGVYFVEIRDGQNRMIEKVIVK